MNQGLEEFKKGEKNERKLKCTRLISLASAAIIALTSVWCSLFPKKIDRQNNNNNISKESSSFSTANIQEEVDIPVIETIPDNAIQIDQYLTGPAFSVTVGRKEVMSGWSFISDEYGVPYKIIIRALIGHEWRSLKIECSYKLVDGKLVPIPRQSQIKELEKTFKEPYDEINAYIKYCLEENNSTYYTTKWEITPSPETINRTINEDNSLTLTYDFKLLNGEVYTSVSKFSDATCSNLLFSHIQNSIGEIVYRGKSNIIDISTSRIYMGRDKEDQVWETISIGDTEVSFTQFDICGNPIRRYETIMAGSDENTICERITSYITGVTYETIRDKNELYPSKIIMPNGYIVHLSYDDDKHLISITATDLMNRETGKIHFSTPVKPLKNSGAYSVSWDKLIIWDIDKQSYCTVHIDKNGSMTYYFGDGQISSTPATNMLVDNKSFTLTRLN